MRVARTAVHWFCSETSQKLWPGPRWVWPYNCWWYRPSNARNNLLYRHYNNKTDNIIIQVYLQNFQLDCVADFQFFCVPEKLEDEGLIQTQELYQSFECVVLTENYRTDDQDYLRILRNFRYSSLFAKVHFIIKTCNNDVNADLSGSQRRISVSWNPVQ